MAAGLCVLPLSWPVSSEGKAARGEENTGDNLRGNPKGSAGLGECG